MFMHDATSQFVSIAIPTHVTSTTVSLQQYYAFYEYQNLGLFYMNFIVYF